ncbi:LysR family transcriptional regulator [Rhizobium binxianense]
MDQLSAMRVFIRVVETGSFSRAAEGLTIPKATVSNLIRNLEDHLRTKLINRTTRRLSVTLDGALYYERAVPILTRLDELDNRLLKANTAPSGRLRVEMAGSIAASVLVPALEELFEEYPDLHIDLGVSPGDTDYVAENVDCALAVGNPSDASLIARHVADLEFVTCASPRYLKQFGLPEDPGDIRKDHRVIAYFRSHTQPPAPLTFIRDGKTIDISPEYVLTVNDSRTFLEALISGFGIGQTPRFTAREAIESEQLVQVLPEWSRSTVPLFIVYPPNRHLSNRVRVFIDWLVKLFANANLNEL